MGFKVKNYRKSIIRLFLSTLAVSFIFILYYSSYIIVKNYISEISDNINITAIIKEDVSEDSLKIAVTDIRKFYWVKDARLIKPDNGFLNTDSSIGGIPGELLPENPLPLLVNVTIKEEYLNKFNLAKYNLLLRRLDIVDSTLQRKDYADTVFLIKTQFSVLSLIIGSLLILIIFLIIFLAINPDFIKFNLPNTNLDIINEYNQFAKEIALVIISFVPISVIISSGIIFSIWNLTTENLPWFGGVSWQILLWNFAFVIIVFELVFLFLFLIYKPKKIEVNSSQLTVDSSQLGTELSPVSIDDSEINNIEDIKEDIGIIEEDSVIEESVIENISVNNDTKNPDKKVENQNINEINPDTTQKEEEITNKEAENWEDDIT